MNPKFICIGDITNDAFIRLTEATVSEEDNMPMLCMKWGEKLPYDSVEVVKAVGNSANASVSISRLGVPVSFFGFVGKDDFGVDSRKVLEAENVDTTYLIAQEGKSTNYHYVLSYMAERTILVRHEDFDYTIPEDLKQNIKQYEWMYLSSVGEAGENLHDDLLEIIKENDIKLIFQPGTFQIRLGYERLKDLYAHTHLFVCNKEEAQSILKTREEDIPKLMDMMLALGPKIVSITDGKDGAYATDGKEKYFIPQYDDIAPPVERTGAGDAYTSTLAAYISEGFSLKEALSHAPVNSMSVVQHIGAQKGLLTRDEIEKFLERRSSNYKITIL